MIVSKPINASIVLKQIIENKEITAYKLCQTANKRQSDISRGKDLTFSSFMQYIEALGMVIEIRDK